MQLIHTIKDMQSIAIKEKIHKKIALVPTMGFLHKGHLSLIEIAKQHADIVIVSIFVNPNQFGPDEDLDKYPRDLDQDLKLCEQMHVDYVFNPTSIEMYPKPFLTKLEVSDLKSTMCGVSRKVHFDGVVIVVNKLLNICQPNIAVLGFKDYQQFVIIQRMITELNIPVKLIGGPTIREVDGLAMSSRNKYITDDIRQDALLLYGSLLKTKEMIVNKLSVEEIKETIAADFKLKNIKLDYFEIKDAVSLTDVSEIKGKLVVAIAAYIGKARLIDNIQITN